jgi:uncharacterized protein (UPF0332 family)
MAFQWQEYLVLAKRLISEGSTDEAALRSAVSRAYYASFNIAAQVLVAKRKLALTGLGEDHARVINYFLASTDAKQHSIGILLKRLRDDRNKADYVETISNWPHTAQINIGRADSVLKLLTEI